MKKVLIVFGTRPEAIKMAPLIKSLEKEPEVFTSVCVTGQHSSLLQPVLDFFSIEADYNLNIIEEKPSLTSVYALILQRIEPILKEFRPDLVLVHGDTATTAAVTMAAFLNQIQIGHVEAGLRTGDCYSPWPEEFNRRLVSLVAHHHFAPTQSALDNLLAENINKKNIVVTGNTVIDALYYTLNLLNKDTNFQSDFYKKFSFIDEARKMVLVTMHRRESFGSGVISLCEALRDLAALYPDSQFVFPVHPNPNVKEPVMRMLSGISNVFLLDPLEYNDFVFMMQKSYFIITDSGGIQEEAPSLGKPVLVTRTCTERPEAVLAETVRLVGTDKDLILSWVHKLMTSPDEYAAMSEVNNPYGDGNACERIVARILNKDTSRLSWFEKAMDLVRAGQGQVKEQM